MKGYLNHNGFRFHFLRLWNDMFYFLKYAGGGDEEPLEFRRHFHFARCAGKCRINGG